MADVSPTVSIENLRSGTDDQIEVVNAARVTFRAISVEGKRVGVHVEAHGHQWANPIIHKGRSQAPGLPKSGPDSQAELDVQSERPQADGGPA